MMHTSALGGARQPRPSRFVEALEDRRLLAASLVRDIVAGTAGSDPGQLTRVGDAVYFTTGLDAAALWKTDGTQSGTVKLRDGRTTILGAIDGKLLFSHEDAAYGVELWTSDGTPQGTALLKDVVSGPDDGFRTGTLAIGDERFFFQAPTAEGAASPWRLWVSDGTPAGTVPVREFTSNLDHANPAVLADGRTALFVAGGQLWTSDGTEIGTKPLFTEPSWAPSAIGSAVPFTEFNGYVYFSASDPVNGTELWRTNGDEIWTAPIMDINPGDASSDPSRLVSAGGHLFFIANDGYSGYELWTTDGTEGGVELTREAFPGEGGPTYATGVAFGAAGDLAYYTLDDGESGLELWRSDGTAAGTHIVADLTPGPASSSVGFLADVNGLLYFVNGDDQVWRTDGTPGGAVQVDLGPGIDRPMHLTLTDAGLLLSARSAATGQELWLIGAPTADAGTSYTVAPDGIVTLDGTGSSDPDPNETLSYVWDLDGDGRFGEFDEGALRGLELGPEPEFGAFGLPEGTYPVTLRVTNSAGLSHEATADVVVRSQQAGVKTVLGDETEADQWTVRYAQGNVQVFRRSGSVFVLEEEWPGVEVRELRFVGGGGDDRVSVFSTLPLTKLVLDGGDGNDTLLLTADNDNGVGGAFERLEAYGGATALVKEDLATEVVEVAEGSRLVLEAGADVTLRTRQLVMDPLFGDRIDVADNELVVEGGDGSAIEALLKAARDGETRWQGSGIGTSAATTLTGLSAFKRGDDVVVKYTYNGDANGDGRINADDYFRIDQGFLGQPANPAYNQGDFNFDDTINADDYFLIDQAFLGQGQALAGGGDASPLTAVAATRATLAPLTNEPATEEPKRRRLRSVRTAWTDSVAPRTSRR